jgi:hypothetical protein
MRILVAFAVLGASLSFTHQASAQGTYYPWCSRYDAYSYNCGFVTWKQCQENISGMGGYCYQNPMPPPAAAPRASKKRQARPAY